MSDIDIWRGDPQAVWLWLAAVKAQAELQAANQQIEELTQQRNLAERELKPKEGM